MVPLGNPLPVKETTVTPGCEVAGVALALSVTDTVAAAANAGAKPDPASKTPGGVIKSHESMTQMSPFPKDPNA
jgi:hypothetical protein